jgi:hypothetical protein
MYRDPVVLCELEGVPRREVARRLGIPEGTLSSRLATAHKMLTGRLRIWRALTAMGPALPALPAELIDSAVKTATVTAGHTAGAVSPAVLNLSRDGGRTMFLTRVAAAGLVVVLVSLAAAVMASVAPAPHGKAAQPIADGVYLLRFEGKGRPVRLGNGERAFLGKRLSDSIGASASLRSVSNDNTRFFFTVKKLGPLPAVATQEQTALVVDGVCMHLGREDKLPPDGRVNTWANVYTARDAGTLAARYKIEPKKRKHPGHRFQVRWVPDKKEYTVGDKVTVNLELTNTGTVPMHFTFGGKQRGPRNNQFRFLAYSGSGYGKAVPDTGDPVNFGGIVQSKTLKPGEVFKAEVALDKWFQFTRADTYRVTGMLELGLIDPEDTNGFGEVIWNDLAVGDCRVRIVAQEK